MALTATATGTRTEGAATMATAMEFGIPSSRAMTRPKTTGRSNNNVSQLLRSSGTTVRGHTGSALPLSQPSTPGGPGYHVLRHRCRTWFLGAHRETGHG